MAEWIRIADEADCPPGEAIERVAGGGIVALFHVGEEWFALDGICPHQGGPLGQGSLSGCAVTCPWHGFQFDVRTGQHTAIESMSQPTLPVKVEAGGVFVLFEAAE